MAVTVYLRFQETNSSAVSARHLVVFDLNHKEVLVGKKLNPAPAKRLDVSLASTVNEYDFPASEGQLLEVLLSDVGLDGLAGATTRYVVNADSEAYGKPLPPSPQVISLILVDEESSSGSSGGTVATSSTASSVTPSSLSGSSHSLSSKSSSSSISRSFSTSTSSWSTSSTLSSSTSSSSSTIVTKSSASSSSSTSQTSFVSSSSSSLSTQG